MFTRRCLDPSQTISYLNDQLLSSGIKNNRALRQQFCLHSVMTLSLPCNNLVPNSSLYVGPCPLNGESLMYLSSGYEVGIGNVWGDD